MTSGKYSRLLRVHTKNALQVEGRENITANNRRREARGELVHDGEAAVGKGILEVRVGPVACNVAPTRSAHMKRKSVNSCFEAGARKKLYRAAKDTAPIQTAARILCEKNKVNASHVAGDGSASCDKRAQLIKQC
jgi:hypothetical protein